VTPTRQLRLVPAAPSEGDAGKPAPCGRGEGWRTGRGPWLSIVRAAEYAGYACENGRAPNSFYRVAREIGHKLNGQWRIHVDELDAYIGAR